MFTGIVEEIGTVTTIRKTGNAIRLGIRTGITFDDLKTGDSLCVNGVCLTVTSLQNNKVVFADVSPETIRKTEFSQLKTNSKVNLERAMLNNGRFGGHFVTGHIDGTATLLKITREDNSFIYTFSCSKEITDGIVKKGSITVNGISLTIADFTDTSFSVAIIPHTIQNTNLQFLKNGDSVNIECDILGKYIRRKI
ncbi:riboflavin synthase [Treponema bryantii]|uniref:riboflavin synthase n=1 Tax=Treponema bryantii TaxID=163 RepID=UPI002B2C5D2C|nr:riboflavin synthase [Treponema bryantii]